MADGFITISSCRKTAPFSAAGGSAADAVGNFFVTRSCMSWENAPEILGDPGGGIGRWLDAYEESKAMLTEVRGGGFPVFM